MRPLRVKGAANEAVQIDIPSTVKEHNGAGKSPRCRVSDSRINYRYTIFNILCFYDSTIVEARTSFIRKEPPAIAEQSLQTQSNLYKAPFLALKSLQLNKMNPFSISASILRSFRRSHPCKMPISWKLWRLLACALALRPSLSFLVRLAPAKWRLLNTMCHLPVC